MNTFRMKCIRKKGAWLGEKKVIPYVNAIKDIPDPEIVDILTRLLKGQTTVCEDDLHDKETTLEALLRMPFRILMAIPVVMGCLWRMIAHAKHTKVNREAREHIIITLAKIDTEEARSVLVKLIKGDDPKYDIMKGQFAGSAARALVNTGTPGSVLGHAWLLAWGDQNEQYAAWRFLDLLRAHAQEALAVVFANCTEKNGELIADTLVAMGDIRLIPILADMCESSKNTTFRGYCQRILPQLRPPEEIEDLLDILEDRDTHYSYNWHIDIYSVAARELVIRGDPRCIPRLIELCKKGPQRHTAIGAWVLQELRHLVDRKPIPEHGRCAVGTPIVSADKGKENNEQAEGETAVTADAGCGHERINFFDAYCLPLLKLEEIDPKRFEIAVTAAEEKQLRERHNQLREFRTKAENCMRDGEYDKARVAICSIPNAPNLIREEKNGLIEVFEKSLHEYYEMLNQQARSVTRDVQDLVSKGLFNEARNTTEGLDDRTDHMRTFKNAMDKQIDEAEKQHVTNAEIAKLNECTEQLEEYILKGRFHDAYSLLARTSKESQEAKEAFKKIEGQVEEMERLYKRAKTEIPQLKQRAISKNIDYDKVWEMGRKNGVDFDDWRQVYQFMQAVDKQLED